MKDRVIKIRYTERQKGYFDRAREKYSLSMAAFVRSAVVNLYEKQNEVSMQYPEYFGLSRCYSGDDIIGKTTIRMAEDEYFMIQNMAEKWHLPTSLIVTRALAEYSAELRIF